LADRLDVANRLDHRPDELSGGEQQRVAIARALINKPRVLFADEPSGNLDRARSEELYALLADARSAWNVAVVVVTHSDWLASKADRRLHLQDGKWS
jgi:lipoprotein-releasing system ATP-binding protein